MRKAHAIISYATSKQQAIVLHHVYEEKEVDRPTGVSIMMYVGCCYEGERPLSIVTFEGRQFLLLWRTWNDADRHRPFFLLSVKGINQTMLQRAAGLLSWVANASNRGNLKFPKCLSRLPRPLLRVTFVPYVVCDYTTTANTQG